MQILQEQKSASAMDGVNADFAGAKICPATDTCQSSNRTLFDSSTFTVTHAPK